METATRNKRNVFIAYFLICYTCSWSMGMRLALLISQVTNKESCQ